jgi:hypothetical protein
MKDQTESKKEIIEVSHEITIKKHLVQKETKTYGAGKPEDLHNEIEYHDKDIEIYNQTIEGDIDLKGIIDIFNSAPKKDKK